MPVFKSTIKNSIGWWEWNDPHSSINLLSLKALEELEKFIPELEKRNLKALVLTSGKPKSFIAGADMKVLQNIKKKEDISSLIDRVHALFQRLEKLSAVKIAAIHGACLGGGLELALTFDYLIASDSPDTFLGLPEVQLGLIPGLGGCLRLPKLVGLKAALQIILKGKPLSSKQALAIGLINEILPPALLQKRAAELAELTTEGKILRRSKPKKTYRNKLLKIMGNSFPLRSLLFYITKKRILKKTKGLYPAPLAALNVIQKTFNSRNSQQALNIEKIAFSNLACNQKSKNLMRVFSLINKAKKPSSLSIEHQIKSIGVVGAGTMGSGLAYTFSYKGFPTRLMDLKEEALSRALKKAENLWDKQMKKKGIGPSSQRMKNLSSTLNYKDLSSLDMVIEAVPETLEAKRQVLHDLAGQLNEEGIVASCTSSLNLKEISSNYPWPHRFLGIHFFNPPYKMPLVEIIKTDKTHQTTLETVLAFVKKIGKIPIVVKDSPGFLVNRLLAFYLCEALWFLNEGKNITQVDECFSRRFGLPLGPFRLMDEIGLDVCFQVVENLQKAGFHLDIPNKMEKLPFQLGLGRKEEMGFYSYGKNLFKFSVNRKLKELFPCSEKLSFQEGVERGIYPLINEAFKALEENIVESENDVDLAMILGMGFPPLYGGPLTYGRQRGLAVLKEQLEFWQKNRGKGFLISEKLKKEALYVPK